jgi:hypothetical protein
VETMQALLIVAALGLSLVADAQAGLAAQAASGLCLGALLSCWAA